MKKILFLFCILLNFHLVAAQSDSSSRNIEIGVRSKKYAGFYYVNGISVQMQSPNSKNGSVYYGIHLSSSVLGSALGSNALSTYEVEFNATKLYRKGKIIQPLMKFNVGFVSVDFGEYSELFENLPQWGIISAIETGFAVNLKRIHPKLKTQITGGFHIYSGGPGVVYPAYVAGLLMWRL